MIRSACSLSILMASIALAVLIPPLRPEGTYALDPPHTFIQFSARHKVVGIVDGRFDRATGTITVSPDLDSCTVDVSIDAQSLSTQNSTRDEDLRGPDFFAASRYPAIE